MDIIPLDGLPYPAMPPARARARRAREVRGVRRHPAGDPERRSRTSRSRSSGSRATRAPTTPTSRRSPHEVGYVFYLDPGPVPGVEQGVLGPGDPRRRAAAGAQRRRWTGRTTTSSLSLHASTRSSKELPIVFIQEPASKAPIPIPIPDITPLNPPLGLVPPLPPKIKFLKDTAKLNPLAAAMTRARLRGPALATRSSAPGTLDVARYGHVLQVAAARRRARRRRGVRRPLLRHVRHLDASSAASSRRPSRSRATACSRRSRRCRHESLEQRRDADAAASTTASTAARCVNNVDPLQIGRIQAIVPDVSGSIPTSWAMPCLPVAGINTGIFTVPQIGSGVWIEFEQGDPDYPIWVGGYWGTPAEVPALAHAGAAGGERHHAADDAAERHRRQRRPRARPAGS